MTRPTSQELFRLLRLRNEHPERLARIDGEIQALTEVHTVVVTDMAGFSRLSMRYGIAHFLAMIVRLQDIALPMLGSRGGQLVKTDADNIFAVFPDVPLALEWAHDLFRRLEQVNKGLPSDWDLHLGIGIGHGHLLMVGTHDMFGSELNLASKLGEDVALGGEILLTPAAHARISSTSQGFERRETLVSGVAMEYWVTQGTG